MKNKIYYSLFRDGVWIDSGTIDELAKKMGVGKKYLHAIKSRRKDIRSKMFAKVDGEKVGIHSVYAYYNGDEFVATGTVKELEEITGMNAATIVAYASDLKKNRRNFVYHNYTLEEI